MVARILPELLASHLFFYCLFLCSLHSSHLEFLPFSTPGMFIPQSLEFTLPSASNTFPKIDTWISASLLQVILRGVLHRENFVEHSSLNGTLWPSTSYPLQRLYFFLLALLFEHSVKTFKNFYFVPYSTYP